MAAKVCQTIVLAPQNQRLKKIVSFYHYHLLLDLFFIIRSDTKNEFFIAGVGFQSLILGE